MNFHSKVKLALVQRQLNTIKDRLQEHRRREHLKVCEHCRARARGEGGLMALLGGMGVSIEDHEPATTKKEHLQ